MKLGTAFRWPWGISTRATLCQHAWDGAKLSRLAVLGGPVRRLHCCRAMRTAVHVRLAILTSLGLLQVACSDAASKPGVDTIDGTDADDVAADDSPTAPDSVEPAGEDETDVTPADSSEPSSEAVVTPVDHEPCLQSVPTFAGELGQQVTNFTPALHEDVATGTHRCEDGTLHRPESVACESFLPRAMPPDGDESDQVTFLYSIVALSRTCAQDADCTAAPHGYCAPVYRGGSPAYDIECKYGCLSDADCDAGQLCECGDPVGHCVDATCRSDSDCEGDMKCAAWFTPVVCSGGQAYACQTPADECRTTADCDAGDCLLEGDRRQCVVQQLAACGRPFLVRGEPRLAALRGGTDWLVPRRRGTGDEMPIDSVAANTVAGEYWATVGLMEHASIAAFARFTMQLMHLGAPAALVEDSRRAMVDETQHAKLCFALASRLLGTAVAPGPLPIEGALHGQRLASITRVVFREGCIGETVAALEAQAALAVVTDDDARDVLECIAGDELRHAQLAWRFVAWALRADPHLAVVLDEQVAEVAAELEHRGAPGQRPAVPEHGVLSALEADQVRRETLRDVVLPCARALLSAHGATKSGSEGVALRSA